jgi:hypothetical protein
VAAAATLGFPVLKVLRTRDPAEQLLFRVAIDRAQELRAEERKDLARRIIKQLADGTKKQGK